MKKLKLLDICLRLFDGGAAAAGGNGAAASSTGAGASAGTVSTKGDTNAQGAETSNGNTRRSSTGDAKGNSTLDAGGAEKTLEERRKAYRSLMDGEYKDIYTEDTQGLINRRFKETKELEGTLAKQKPILDILAQKFGIDDGDPDKIAKALQDDDDFWSMAADRAGMDTDTFKELTRLKAKERAETRQRQAQEQARQAVERENRVKETSRAWAAEAEALKATYPDFDLDREIGNKEFSDSLAFYQKAQVGNPVERAYKATHHDELVSRAVDRASAETEKNVVDNIRAKGARPTENGTQSRSAFTGKVNVHNLSRAERAELARRAERGEKISFSS